MLGRRASISFSLNAAARGRSPRQAATTRRRPILDVAKRDTASRSRTSATRTAATRPATAAPAWSRSTASACSRRRAAARRAPGMEVHDRQRARARVAAAGARAAAGRHARDRATRAATRSTSWAERLERGQAALRAARRSLPADCSHPAMAVRPRRLHPVHALRARLPRGAGQRRDRPGPPRRARQDRVRPRRPDGRVDLRGLRRMRAGLPDRRADADARRRAWRCPTSRSTRCARTAASAASSPTTSRTTRSSRRRPRRPGQPQPAVRQGPLRLRLRAPPAAPDHAADPPRRRAQDAATSRWTPPT